MSRSALWHQEKNHAQRQAAAEEVFLSVCESGRDIQKYSHGKKNSLVPMWSNCSDSSFHLNPMLLQNIIHSPYFIKICESTVTDWNTLVDEIYYHVKHLEPWNLGGGGSHNNGKNGSGGGGGSRAPSTAFCLLLRLMTLRCTEKQMKLMLSHEDSPHIRGVGFLYLRYICDPKAMWTWIQPYLFDTEPLQVRVGGCRGSSSSGNRNNKGSSNRDCLETVGDFVRYLFTTNDYFGTVLPRLPVPLERDLKVKLLQAEQIHDRAKQHFSRESTMRYFQSVGNKVLALYGDEENPIQWYHAVIDRVIPPTTKDLYHHDQDNPGTTTSSSLYPSFIVTFPEYGNTETVSLGELDMITTNKDGGEGRITSSRSRSPRRNDCDYDQDYDRQYRRNDWDDRDRDRYTRGDDRRYQSRSGGRDYDRDDDRGYNSNHRGTGRDHRSRDGGRGRRGRGYDDDYDAIVDDDRYSSSSSSRAGVTGQPIPLEQDLYEEVRRRERDNVTASGRDFAVRRPLTTKSMLSTGPSSSSSQGNHGSRRKRYSSSPSPPSRQSYNNNNNNNRKTNGASSSTTGADTTEQQPPPKKQRTAEQIAATEAKKRKLLAKYG